jgi:hypothetical protein
MSAIAYFVEELYCLVCLWNTGYTKNVVAVKEITVTKVGYEQQSFFRLPSEKPNITQSQKLGLLS